MPKFGFYQKIIHEYWVEAENEEKAREFLVEDPHKYLEETSLSPEHDQEQFFFIGEFG